MKLSKQERSHFFLLPLAAAGIAVTAGNANAQLAPGQSILLDFGNQTAIGGVAPGPTSNFINNAGQTQFTPLDSLTEFNSGDTVTVGLELASGDGTVLNFFNDDSGDIGSPNNNMGSPGFVIPAPFNSAITEDWAGVVNAGSFDITLTGLDPLLTYDISYIVGGFTNNAVTDDITLEADGQSAPIGAASNDPRTATLSGLTTDADGTLLIQVVEPNIEGSTDTEVAVISGLFIEAIGDTTDTDGDGLSDEFENANLAAGYDPNVDNSNDDFDNDASTTAQELAVGTNVLLPDTDGDGFNDGAEDGGGTFVSFDPATNTGMTGTSPLSPDTDGDGLLDGVEFSTGSFVDASNTGSDPNIADTDEDGLSDNFETINNGEGYDPNIDNSGDDFDGDASTTAQELVVGTDVLLSDTDGDGFFDGAEDGGGTFVSYDFVSNTGMTGTNPLVADTDMDGLPDGEEPAVGANPNLVDTDGDTFDDGVEVASGTDPNNAQSLPDFRVLEPSADGTFFVSPTAGNLFNPTVVRAGGNNAGEIEFVGLLVFDLDGIDASDLQAGPLTLRFDLGAEDNTPPLDDLQVDYVGTFASDVLGGGPNNAADPNASVLANAPVVTSLFNGSPEFGELALDATAIIASDTFTERYAVFRLTDPTVAPHQWDIADLSNATEERPAATLTIGGARVITPSDLILCIENDPADSSALLFSWNSRPGFTYDILSNADLSTPVADFPVFQDDVAADPSGINTLSVPRPAVPTNFFVLVETEIPLQTLFVETFDNADGGFTNATTAGTTWAFGMPNSSGLGGTVDMGNTGVNAWGTNITNPGFLIDPTTDSCLRSAVIDLTAVTEAQLTFAQAIDLDAADTVTVNIIDDITDMVIAADIAVIVDDVVTNADWSVVDPIEIPAAALGQLVRIEWCIVNAVSANTDDFLGWYIDDVEVTGR